MKNLFRTTNRLNPRRTTTRHLVKTPDIPSKTQKLWQENTHLQSQSASEFRVCEWLWDTETSTHNSKRQSSTERLILVPEMK